MGRYSKELTKKSFALTTSPELLSLWSETLRGGSVLEMWMDGNLGYNVRPEVRKGQEGVRVSVGCGDIGIPLV